MTIYMPKAMASVAKIISTAAVIVLGVLGFVVTSLVSLIVYMALMW